MATVPEAKDALNKFKMEAASEESVTKHLTSQKMTVLSQILRVKKWHRGRSNTLKHLIYNKSLLNLTIHNQKKLPKVMNTFGLIFTIVIN
jgi:hypothetical protein